MSGAFDRPISANISPFTEFEEKTIICTVFTELNEKFCVGLDNPPSFSRSIAAPPTVHSMGGRFLWADQILEKSQKPLPKRDP